ncbi:MAG TPA: hypothetical protein HA262_09945 [Methanosarcina sp.]|jgi:predicted ribosomally synthesized peptide with SipW-like signal peptide|nr:hypothetical protein [Methanosarcina sp.]
MLNKKMLLSVLILGVVATAAGAGTWAFFDDSLPVAGNTITAGTLNLDGSLVQTFAVSDAIPDSILKTIPSSTYTLTNGGTITGKLSVTPTITGDADILSHMHIYINGHELENGVPYELANLDGQQSQTVEFTYKYDDAGVSQNTEQGDTVTCDLEYYLKQL